MNELDDRLMTVPEVAKHFNCSHQTVWRMINTGVLKSLKLGRNRRVRLSDLREYVNSKVDDNSRMPDDVTSLDSRALES